MEILLIRHSTAEDKRADLEDIKRHLTEKGVKKFQKLMPELKEKLEPLDQDKILLWSSPAARALETAEIVAKELNIEINAVHDFIYSGEFEKLSAEVQNIKDEMKILVVGHEPTLSEWTKQMTDEDVKIKKGAILNLKVVSRSPLEAELQWVIAPE